MPESALWARVGQGLGGARQNPHGVAENQRDMNKLEKERACKMDVGLTDSGILAMFCLHDVFLTFDPPVSL